MKKLKEINELEKEDKIKGKESNVKLEIDKGAIEIDLKENRERTNVTTLLSV